MNRDAFHKMTLAARVIVTPRRRPRAPASATARAAKKTRAIKVSRAPRASKTRGDDARRAQRDEFHETDRSL